MPVIPMQRLIPLVVVVAAMTAPACAQEVWQTDLDAARRESQKLNRPLLLHFGAKWCGPCQMMERSVLNQPTVAQQLRANVIGVKIDIDRNPELAQRFNVNQFPTDVFLEPDGRELLNSTAAKSLEEYLSLIDRAGRRYRELLVQREDRRAAPIVTDPQIQGDNTQLAKSAQPMLMLESYCPWTLSKDRKWIKGQPEITATFKGQTYCFVSPEARAKFLEAPDRFVPQYLGCDPVIAWTSDRSILGSIEWGAFFEDRLYLFATEDNRRTFKTTPEKFLQTKVVLHVDDIESVLR